MKSNLEILGLIKENIKPLIGGERSCQGVCDVADRICNEGSITQREFQKILRYLEKNLPWRENSWGGRALYCWPSYNNSRPRTMWVNKQIKKLS